MLFGRSYSATVSIDHLGRDGFKIRGTAVVGGALPVAAGGDVNGDGKGDVLVTRGLMGLGGLVAPAADVVHGSTAATTVDLAHPGARVTRMPVGDIPPGDDLQVGPLAGLGDFNHDGHADIAVRTETFPVRTGGTGPYQGTVSVILAAAPRAQLTLSSLGDAGFQLTTPVPQSSCPPGAESGNRLGSTLTALGAFTAPSTAGFAVGATGLGTNGSGPCAIADVCAQAAELHARLAVPRCDPEQCSARG